uniref:C2H2-type domain-containing protein n=1 Tax=Oryza brachyantha TaxID=4533 RepID=J3MMN4_ORYBR
MDAVAVLSGGAGSGMRRCRVCGKGFSCGRSLGGHMRSHVTFGDAVAEADGGGGGGGGGGDGDGEVNGGRCSNGVVGYGLRENPKKTRRLSEFDEEDEVVEEGGDGGELMACRECGKLFSTWRSLVGHMRRHASGGRDRGDEDDEFDGPEAEEEEEVMVAPAAVTVIAAPPRRRRRSMRVAAPAPAPPPVPGGGVEKEQEDVALCLLMLSRDTGMWRSPVKAVEPFEMVEQKKKKATAKQPPPIPRNGYGYNSDEDSALLQCGDAKTNNTGRGGGDVAKCRKRRASYYAPNSISPKQQQQQRAAAPAKRTRYECPGCGKVFSSYQALGGHRASHKRINTSCSAPKAAAATATAPEPSSETYASLGDGTLSPSASPDSVATAIGNSKTNKSAAEKFGGQQVTGACSDDGELYASSSGNVELELEQHSPPAATAFLDLNFPPASSSEVA